MRKIILLIISLTIFTSVFAKMIHDTAIITPNNKLTLVYLWIKVGTSKEGACVDEYIIQNIPSEQLCTGDHLEVDGDMIKRLVGPGMTCASYNFQKEDSKIVVSDKFLLESDNAGNYIASQPFTGTAVIP